MHIGVDVDVFVVMSEVPLLEVRRVVNRIQKFCNGIRLIVSAYVWQDVGWTVVCQDVVNRVCFSEILLCIPELLVGWHFLRPPRCSWRTILFIVRYSATHGEKRFAAQVEDLTAHQVEDAVCDFVNPPAIPLRYGIVVDNVEVLVVAVYKQSCPWLSGQPLDPIQVLSISHQI